MYLAKNGDRIIVHPGTYVEKVIVDKSVEIIGEGTASPLPSPPIALTAHPSRHLLRALLLDLLVARLPASVYVSCPTPPGDKKDICIEFEGHSTVTLMSDTGRLANLTIRQLGPGADDGCYGVDITRGRPFIEDCDVSCQAVGGIAIHGTGTDPTIHRNRLYVCTGMGVSCFDNAGGSITENDIFNNDGCGVNIESGAHPTVVNNVVRDNRCSPQRAGRAGG